MIYIRVDANEIIATGHMMRCMSVAGALQDTGKDVCFLLADEKGEEILKQSRFHYIVLHSNWNKLENELPVLRKILSDSHAEAILIDSYFVTERYMRILKEYVKVAYIDDLNAFHYPCDVLINYSVYAEDFSYPEFYKNSKLLLGCQYVPLRKEFANIYYTETSEKVQNVLILTGGSDAFHFALKFSKEIIRQEQKEKSQICYHIICGRYNEDINRLQQLKKEFKNLQIYTYVENIAEIMQRMDLAISAGGSTLYELCACGIPTITYTMADNQIMNVKKFAEINLMNYSGDIRKNNYDYGNLFRQLVELSSDVIKRKQMAAHMRKLVDGNGAKRIAGIL